MGEGAKSGGRATSGGAPAGLYLRLPSLESGQADKVKVLLGIFSGQTDVYVRLLDTGKLMRHPLRAGNIPYLCEQMKELLGEENVALVGELFD